MKLLADRISIDSMIIQDLIDADINSDFKKRVRDGENYYHGKHDYLDHKNYYHSESGKAIEMQNRANNLIAVQFFTLSNDQKIERIMGKNVTITVNEPEVINKKKPTPEEEKLIAQADEFQKVITTELNARFQNTLRLLLHGATNKAVEWLHYYVDPQGNFRYVITSALGIIPIYDMQYEDKLLCIIRYYRYPFMNPDTKRQSMLYKLEKWTDNEVTYWEQQEDLTWAYDFSYEINPAPHWVDENKTLGKTEKHGFGRVPFVPVYNNAQMTTDLQAIKALIDAYDSVISGWVNDLEDIKQLILILKGYEGLMKEGKDVVYDLEQYLKSLYSIGAITVKEGGDVTNPKNDIPIEARREALTLLRERIFEIGRMSDTKNLIGGNMTNVGIQANESGIMAKCNAMLSLAQESLEQMMWFHVFWINKKYKKNYDYKQIKFTFNITQPFNEVEYMTILNATLTTGKLSEQTYLEKSTFVDNADEEMARLEAERERKIEQGAGSLDKYISEDENGDQGNANSDENVQENENQQNNEQRK